ncbi:MAG: type I DNA topoisomerase [Clostridia bacterium]|nr:type I DNA topoisomerase [Clostridia bacterium]
MKLIIVESPHKAKTISKYLGSGYHVVASKGHVSDLPQKTMGIDVNNNFKPEYIVSPDKQATIDMIKKEIEKCDTVYLAADPDREGEAISWHLANVCGITEKNVRIVFNEISKKAVLKALDNPREINMGLVDAQQARRVLDRLMGYELSPIISRQIKSGLSAGRVQSVALKMVVDREREIRDFKPQEYWTISAQLVKDKISAGDKKKNSFKCEFVDIDGKKVKVTCKEQADEVIGGSKAGKWLVDNVKRAQSFSKPAPPFTTSTMQQDAISKLGFSASMVTQIAQRLYEGVEIQGEGQVALVTYIRSDSVRVSADAQREALEFIDKNYGKDYCPKKPNVYATGSGAQDAHEAIRPITLARTPESLKDKLARNDYKLYKLIYDRFVASQMANAVYDTLTVHIVSQSDKNYGYTLKGKVCVFKGFTQAYQSNTEKEESSKELPNLNEGEELTLKDIAGEQKFTKPPQRYTDGSFIKAMEENGIGRPSTFEKTITVLYKRTYIEKDGKFMKPTELGEIVVDQLVKDFTEIMDTQFTADMEKNLDKIEEGNIKWYEVIADFYGDFHNKVIAVKYQGNKVKPKAEESDVICDKCGARMIIRDSKYGKFLACPNFPKCRNTKSLSEAVAKCPQCGGDVYKKVSKKGATFFSCNNYPTCKFISWDLPAPYLCPDCKNTMKVVNGKSGVKYVCTNRDCKHSEDVEESKLPDVIKKSKEKNKE